MPPYQAAYGSNMPDVFSKEKRSEVMSLIRSKNSKAERLVFRFLNQKGVYYQKHYKRAPGKPDIALPRKKIAVFIDGDFWHGRNYEHRLRGRNDNDAWVRKVKRNMERDAEQVNELKKSGWKVLRVWESDINRKRSQDVALASIKDFLAQPSDLGHKMVK